MTRTLVWKELHQHWPAFLILMLLAGTGLALTGFAASTRGEYGSVFDPLRPFLVMIVPLSCLVLCNRLVVVEYQSKTQIFLGALPLSTSRMILVKYVLGLAAVGGIVLASTLLICVWAVSREGLSLHEVRAVVFPPLAFAWFCYGFFFLMGFLGRYRLALYLALFLGVLFLDSLTEWELSRFAPFRLIDERFGYETVEWPMAALVTTSAWALVFLVASLALGVPRAGSLASLLAERMSYREKVFIAASLIGILLAVTILEEKQEKAAYDLHDAVVAELEGVTVKMSVPGQKRADATGLVRQLAAELAGVREYLRLPALPPVFLTWRSDLDGRHYERGTLEAAEGLHARLNPGGSGWEESHFAEWLIREILVVQSDGRLELESRRWILDGFPLYWLTGAKLERSRQRIESLEMRAAYGAPAGVDAGVLIEWLSFRERVGEEIAAGVAWAGLESISRQCGSERCRDFVAATLGFSVPRDVRALIEEWMNPWTRSLQETTGWVQGDLVQAWNHRLAEWSRAYKVRLEKLPRLQGTVTFEPISELSRKVKYKVQLMGSPPGELQYRFIYCSIPVFDEEVEPAELKREVNAYPEVTEGELPETFSRGTRLYWTFAFDSEVLGCPVISGWNRQEIP